jgi:hypothetical protein
MTNPTDRLSTLYGDASFWRGALFARTSIVSAAEIEASPTSEAAHRSERLLSEQRGEHAVIKDRAVPMSPEERAGHDEAIERLKVLLGLAEAGEDVTASDEFVRWRSYDPAHMLRVEDAKRAAEDDRVRELAR